MDHPKQQPVGGPSFVPWALLVEGSLIAVAMVLSWAFDQPPLGQFAMVPSAIAWGVAATLPMLLLFFMLRAIPWSTLVRLRSLVDRQVLPLFRGWSVWDLASLSLVAGVAEEMLFRGVIQDVIARGTGPLWALLIASVMFGVVHSITPAYAVVATLLGLWLGGAYLYTGNLLVAMIAHALYDFLALVIMLRYSNVAEEAFEEDDGEAS